MARVYILANYTGLKLAFKPELFTDTPNLTITGITMATSGYQYAISNYKDYQQSYGEIPYTSERRVGYDANTGLNKALNVVSAGGQLASAVGTAYSGIATANPSTVISGIGSAVNMLPCYDGMKYHHNMMFVKLWMII